MSFTTANSNQQAREIFLTRNYHLLCFNLRPIDFFSWLRTKHVFSISDQEEVLKREVTTVNQMGELQLSSYYLLAPVNVWWL